MRSPLRGRNKSLPLEGKPLKERKPKPPSDEGGGPKGRRERKVATFYLRCGNTEPGSLPQSTSLTAPSSEGAKETLTVSGKPEQSLPQSASLTAPSSEGAKGGVSRNLHRQRGPRGKFPKTCIVRGGRGSNILYLYLPRDAYAISRFRGLPPRMWKCRWGTVWPASGPQLDTTR